ncbi:HAMP domain-containing histidine kinase [Candidatus Poribacteria bacterium]|nr:HAMP domain-containing histidine kinase [Candidatus Poribacteria bacterium]
MYGFLRIPTESEPKKRINWLICFRWLVIASAVFIVLIIRLFKPNIIHATSLFITVAALCLCNIFFLTFSRWKRFKENDSKHYVISTHIQLIFDLFFLTTFLHFFGGLETPFFFFYLIYVSIASIFLPRTFDLIYAGLASSLYLGMLILEWQEIIPHYNISGFRLPIRFQEPTHIFTAGFALVATSFLTAYFVSTIVARLRERENELIGSNISCEVRAKELAELNVRLEEQDKARAQFIWMVTHELRAPVAAIQSYLKLILDGYIPPERQQEIISKSERQAMQQLELIGDLLDLAKLHEPKFEIKVEPVDIAKLLEEVCDLMSARAGEKNISLNVNIEPGLPLVDANMEHIRHIWMDLISNSIKYTGSNGIVTISLSRGSDSLIGTVADTGIGIAEGDIPHIFDEFYRAKNAKSIERHGTGLGLSIVKRVLDKYKGSISVESELGKGSKFTFEIPLAQIK